MDRLLGGTRHHYGCIWPAALGRFKNRLLLLFFSGIRLEEPQAAALKALPEDAVVAFAAKSNCLFSFLFAYTRYRRLGLPYPRIGLGCRSWLWPPWPHLLRVVLANLDGLIAKRRRPDMWAEGYLQQELLKGRNAFLALIEGEGRRGFGRRRKPARDPLELLIELQKTTERAVLIVPHLMLFGRKPRRLRPSLVDALFGPEDDPGRLRRLAMLFNSPGKIFVEISPPIALKEFIDRPEIAAHASAYQAALLRGEILERLHRHRQSITGPALKSRRELKAGVLNGERLQQFLEVHAQSHSETLAEMRSKAAACLDEIAADIQPNWIRVYSGIIGWVFRTMYDGVVTDPEEIAAVKRRSLDGAVVFLPSHKSHVDYLILSYLLYHNDMPCPLVAAGRNLSFWPLGPLLRRGGAFFIRRTFKGDPLYSRTFSAYVHKVLEEGYNVEQFIEGGRSRTGKLLMPKLGMLSILLNAYRNAACRDLAFIPVAIGYDQVLEEKSYLSEIEGGAKKAESFLQFLQLPKFLRKRYGKIYVQMGAPISLRELEAAERRPLAEMDAHQLGDFCNRLARRISQAINRKGVVTPHALAAAAILGRAQERLTFEELLESAEVFMNHLVAVGARLADTLVLDHRQALGHAVASYARRKILDAVEPAPEGAELPGGFILIEGKRAYLEYYKNTCLAFFIPAAFTALAILQKDAFQFSVADLDRAYTGLQELFRLEFVFDDETPAAVWLSQSLKRFEEEAFLIPHPELADTYSLTSAGFRQLKGFAMLLKPLLESYWVVLRLLMQTPAEDAPPRDLAKKCAAAGARMLRQREIESREALSKVSFDNALAYFESRGIRGRRDEAAAREPNARIQDALRFLKS
jgi:glycerol-3-phosphate O-acyltransferase